MRCTRSGSRRCEEEALRDLVRAREDLRGDLMRARQRLSKLLLRHEFVYEDTRSTWTVAHRAWLRAQDLGGGAQATLLDYLGAIDTLELRRDALETTIAELVPARRTRRPSPGCGACAGSTRSLRSGWPPRSATSRRFDRPGTADELPRAGAHPRTAQGETRRQGKITKTGSRHARRLLVEARLALPQDARARRTLQRRQDGQPATVIEISWQAQRRLHNVWQRLAEQRGKRRTIVAVAVARELAGFCWALARAD